MGKVEGGDGDKFRNEIAGRRKRKKRIKELEILRRKILETKRKLREKSGLPKTQSSRTLAKILNKFADQRQVNDNKTQGFDNKGRKTGRKRMCNRLLPLREPQAGTFANGSKGAEMKRENLSWNQSDKARFEGDLQKLLCNEKCISKEFKSDGLKKVSERRLSTELFASEHQVPIENSYDRTGAKISQISATGMRKSFKRKIQDHINPDEWRPEKSNSEIEVMEVAVQDMKIKPERKNIVKKSTWKRNLFKDEEGDLEHCVREPVATKLRFSPSIAKANIDQEKSKMILESAEPGLDTARSNSDYGPLGNMAMTRYEELCSLVCKKNFENCFRGISHIDPLKAVKKSLTNFYVDSCRRKSSQKKSCTNESTSGVSIAEQESKSSKNSCWPSKSTKELQRLKGGTVPHEHTENSENVRTKCHILATRQSLNEKSVFDLLSLQHKFRNEIPVQNLWAKERPCFDFLTSEGSSNSNTNNSLGVNNCRNPKASLRTDLANVDPQSGGQVRERKVMVQTMLAGIPENRQKIMLRYLKDQQLVGDKETILTPELATSNRPYAENTDFQKPRSLKNQLKRHTEVKNNDEKKRNGGEESCLEKLHIVELKKNKRIGAGRYLGVKTKNFDYEISEDEMTMRKQMKRCQEAKNLSGEARKKCVKHVPAILRKSRNRRIGECPAPDSAELPFLKRKAQSSPSEILMEKPSKTASQFFIDVKTAAKNNENRVQGPNFQPKKNSERKTIKCNIFKNRNSKNLTDRREMDMTNDFEKSPSLGRLENLAAQTSKSLIYLNDEKNSEDRSLFFSRRGLFDVEIGANMANQNLTKIFSPISSKPRVENNRRIGFIFPNDNRNPKVITIHENDRSQNQRTLGSNSATFLKPNHHHIVSASSGLKTIPLLNELNGLHQVSRTDSEILAYNNFDPTFKKSERRNPVNVQPRVVYQDQVRVLELANDSVVYLEPATFNIVHNSWGEFRQPVGSIDRGHVQRWVSLPYTEGNSNFNGNLQTTAQLLDGRRVQGLILPRNEQEMCLQNIRVDHPVHGSTEKIIQHQEYGPILTQNQNSAYKYLPADPYTRPLDGYERNQIDESGSNQCHHQPVIQPAYNVPGADRPQEVSHNYFCTGP